MTTVQKQIRSGLQAICEAALPAAHVLMAPRFELGKANLPAVCIFGHEDRPREADANTTQEHQRVYTVRVEICAEAAPEDDATDAMAVAIRRAALAENILWPIVDEIHWSAQMWAGNEGEDPMARTALDFDFTYLYDPSTEVS